MRPDLDKTAPAEAAALAASPRPRPRNDNPTRDLWEIDPSLASHASGATGEGILIADARRPGFPVVWANKGFERLTGYPESEVLGKGCNLLEGAATDPLTAQRLEDAFAEGRGCDVVIRHHRHDGTPFWNAVSIHPVLGPDQRPIQYIVVQSDASAAVDAAERADRAGRLDGVTGLPGRRAFIERLEQTLLTEDAPHTGLAVFFVDIDGFRRINAERGHAFGDELLFSAARRIAGAAGVGDIVARAGADEFLVLSLGLERDGEVVERARGIVGAFDDPFELDGEVLEIGASIGVATATDTTGSAGALLGEAEAALQRAPGGVRRFELFDAELRERIRAQAELGAALADALRRDELALAYQPIVDLASGRVVAFEALARWRHPDLGTIPPQTFVGVAEETGSSGELLARVLEHAAADFARIATADPTGEVGLAFNVSPSQLRSDSLLDGVAGLIERTCVEPERIVVEIAENALSGEAEEHRSRVAELRDLGVRVALDDFGTASTSISQLRALPVDQVKLDRSFVAGLGSDSSDAALAAGLLPMARALGIEVVAEGIETDQHLAHLFALGYRLGQGFRFAIAVPASEAAELVSHDPMFAAPGDDGSGVGERRELFRLALIAGDAKRATDVVGGALAAGVSALTIQTEIIGSALHWIGSEWEAGRLDVADEHLATAICERQLATVFDAMNLGRGGTRFSTRVVLAALVGQQRCSDLRLAADALDSAGYETVFLGSGVEANALRNAVRTHRPKAVCLTVDMPEGGDELSAAMSELRAEDDPPIVLVGGRGSEAAPEVDRRLIPLSSPDDALAVLTRELAAAARSRPRPRPARERAA